MENDDPYAQVVKDAIQTAPHPLPLAASPFDDLSSFIHPGAAFRRTHHKKHNQNGKIIPPANISYAIDIFWDNNIDTPNNDPRLKKSKKKHA